MPLTAVDATWLWNGLLWLAVVLTVVSGAQYLWRALARRGPQPAAAMRYDVRCDVVAVGTELLLGQIVDTNSAWIGEQLAADGIDSLLQVKVGDNLGRIVAALRDRLAEADAVIVCGGLGPTHDDITREAIADGDGRRAATGRRGRRPHPRDVRVPRPARCRTTTSARPWCRSARR